MSYRNGEVRGGPGGVALRHDEVEHDGHDAVQELNLFFFLFLM